MFFVGISFPTNAFSSDDCEGLFGTDGAFANEDVEDCSTIVPCSKWVKLKAFTTGSKQTCKDYCELSDDLTCVASWTANDRGGTDTAQDFCAAVEQSTCEQEYDTVTPVVCVCAQVAKCTLFTKCDKESKVSNKIAMSTAAEFDKNRGKGFSIDPRM